MARIIYPDDFAGQQTLFKAILAQHEALGTKSPLTPFAKLQKLDLVKMKNAIAPAAEQNAASGSLRRSSEEDTQQRNLTMEMPWAHFTGEVDFLKGFYKGMERQLGEWGITVDGKDRIVYPNGTAARVDLMKIFVEHHQSFAPGESPLQWYMDEHPDINIEDDLQAAKDALEIEVARDKASGDSEQATQTRNHLWEPAEKAIRLIGNYLMGLYKENSRKMAAWGFEVVEDAAGETLRTSKLKPSASKTNSSVVVGSVFTNTGKVDLLLYRGKKAEGDFKTVKPDEMVGMVKGFSVITVVNPSTLLSGEYTVMVHGE